MALDIDNQLQTLEQQLLMIRGELAESEQRVKATLAEAHRTEGRILQLREIKQQQAEAEKDKA